MGQLMGIGDTQIQDTVSGFQFSSTAVENLGASEYTLVTSIIDLSGSVFNFRDDLEKCMATVVDSCRKSPRAANLLMRSVTFNSSVNEFHGFVELKNINPNDFKGKFKPNGNTALYDATLNSLEAMETYAKQLASMDYTCNAVAFIITDGLDNQSAMTPAKIKSTIERLRKNDDILESINVILIGVGDDQSVMNELDHFKNTAHLDQFVKMGEATPAKLAKLASFISKSISSSSQALGTGGPSAPVQVAF